MVFIWHAQGPVGHTNSINYYYINYYYYYYDYYHYTENKGRSHKLGYKRKQMIHARHNNSHLNLSTWETETGGFPRV